ncbi:MAG: ATP-binding protein [Spartobacteria bacterium]|nr:ATP-binding protein [Spartobacteria bacterium]
MNDALDIASIIRLRDELIEAVSSFAAREQALNAAWRRETDDAARQHAFERQELDNALAAAESRADATWYQARQAAESKYSARTERIDQAAKHSRQAGLERIEQTEGTSKNQLQKEMMQTRQAWPEGKQRISSVYDEFMEILKQQHDALSTLSAGAYRAVAGYGGFVRWLSEPAHDESIREADEYELNNRLTEVLGDLDARTRAFRAFRIPAFFRALPLWLFVTLALLAVFLLVPVLMYFRQTLPTIIFIESGILVALGAVGLVHALGKRQARPSALRLAEALKRARSLHDTCLALAHARFERDTQALTLAYNEKMAALEAQWEQTNEHAAEARKHLTHRLAARKENAHEKNEFLHTRRLQRLEEQHTRTKQALAAETEANRQQCTAAFEAAAGKRDRAFASDWQALTEEWEATTRPLYQTIETTNAFAAKCFPAWDAAAWDAWTPPDHFIHATRFGQLQIDLARYCPSLPTDPRLALPGPAAFPLPLSLSIPFHGSLLFETKQAGQENVMQALNTLMLRLLLTTPPGKICFTILDPVGLGRNFAGIMHLADYEEFLITSRIWTQPRQIEEQLAHLNEHMEKVIQMYLRNEYTSITEYNDQAGEIAEKYHFLVVADFPANFSDTAAKRLLSIAASGARCGVYSLIHWDQRLTLPEECSADDLRANSICLTGRRSGFILRDPVETPVVLDAPPAPERMTTLLQQVGRASIDSNRVEVPFAHIAPDEAHLWSADTARELTVPIGRTGATKLQLLAIGRDTRQHGLIAGKTGSGKSNLFHVIITNTALWCSPEQVEFYLVDFKKGVEFKCYATHRLPHARVVAIESDREFGLSVLQRVDEELKQRGDLFRALGVQDMEAYRATPGARPLPRTLLIIDEFQELFIEDDRIAQDASLLLDRIVRQGRAFGIHVLVGSQTLGGAYTLARTTIGQMVIRVALQCNEADAFLIMSDNNPAPRLLSRPGEAIYNNSAGAVEGNSPFQVVWLPDDVRETCLTRIQERCAADGTDRPAPIVFEGNTPADIGDNTVLQSLLATGRAPAPAPDTHVWLGAPNAIKGPTEAVFHRQSGNHLLIVGQQDETALALLAAAIISLRAQYAPGRCRVLLLDALAPETPHDRYLSELALALPGAFTRLKARDLPDLMTGLADDLAARDAESTAETAPPLFLLIHELQKFKKLRFEEDFSFSLDDTDSGGNPADVFNTLIKEGPTVGMHVIATCDTCNNVNRAFARKTLSEFEMRVLFQMSANDSATLIDSPDAGHLGLHRAIFYNEQEGYRETFRPYALPGPSVFTRPPSP